MGTLKLLIAPLMELKWGRSPHTSTQQTLLIAPLMELKLKKGTLDGLDFLLLIAPLMELKWKNYLARARDVFSFNRTAYGIEITFRLVF